MLETTELAETLNIFSLMREALGWVSGAVETFSDSPQARLQFWNNLRVFLILFATFDSLRRSEPHETLVFGTTAQ